MTRREAAKNLLDAIDQYVLARKEEVSESIPFDKAIEELLKEGVGEFKPHVFFNWDGGGIECWISNAMDYSKDYGLMSIAFELETDKIAGVQVGGVLRAIKEQLIADCE